MHASAAIRSEGAGTAQNVVDVRFRFQPGSLLPRLRNNLRRHGAMDEPDSLSLLLL